MQQPQARPQPVRQVEGPFVRKIIGKETDDRKAVHPRIRELVLLTEIDSPHVDHFVPTSFALSEGCFSVLHDGGVDVRKIIDNEISKPDRERWHRIAKSIFFQLLLSLDELHKRKIVHGNVTTTNLSVMAPDARIPGIVKLMNFETAKVVDNETEVRSAAPIAPLYRAPEVRRNSPYTSKSDVWAAACVFSELLTGRQPKELQGMDQPSPQMAWQRGPDVTGPMHMDDGRGLDYGMYTGRPMGTVDPTFELRQKIRDYSQEGSNLFEKMIVDDPNTRISASEALRHPYFNEEPICVLNVAGQFPREEWERLRV